MLDAYVKTIRAEKNHFDNPYYNLSFEFLNYVILYTLKTLNLIYMDCFNLDDHCKVVGLHYFTRHFCIKIRSLYMLFISNPCHHISSWCVWSSFDPIRYCLLYISKHIGFYSSSSYIFCVFQPANARRSLVKIICFCK